MNSPGITMSDPDTRRDQPPCAKCGATLVEACVEHDTPPGYETMTFQCRNCDHVEQKQVGPQ